MNLPGPNNLMLAPRNTTTVGASPQLPFSNPIGRLQTRLSSTVLNTECSPELMRLPNMGISTKKNAEIPAPQLDVSCHSFKPEFISQGDVDTRWTALKEYLTGATLQEQEILEVLSSGILQTDTGRAISELFENAFIRSIRSRGNLSEARLKVIVDVLCHLPPGQWQAALGEQARFSSDHRADGVMGFIQSRLDASSAERDEKIAHHHLVSDEQWDAIKNIIQDVGRYVRSSNKVLHSAFQVLQDHRDLRPSPKDAQNHLEDVKHALRDSSSSERRRWDDSLIDKVEAVYDQLKPGYQGASAESQAVNTDELISLRFFNTPTPVVKGQFSLLEELQGFERHANFYTYVSTTGPVIAEGFFARFLYACNALDTFGALRLDASHITTRPASIPSSHAWKNGESDLPKSPLTPDPEQPQADAMDPLAGVGQFAAQVDELLSRFFRNAVPWDSAHAQEEVELETMLEPFGETPYQPTTTGLPPDTFTRISADMDVLKEQLGNWLSRMSSSLLGTGAAVLSRTGDLIEQNPGKAVGMFAAYMAVSNFYASWFLPEPEEAVDPLQGVHIHPDPVPDEGAMAHEYAIEGIEDIFELFPVFAAEVKQLINKTSYEVPTDDPELIEKLEELLRQPVPGHPNVTYGDYLDEITVGAKIDAHDEFEADDVSDLKVKPVVTTETRLFVADKPAHVIRTRSVDEGLGMFSNVQTSESGVEAHSYAHLLIHAGQRTADAEVGIGPGEEFVPGFTISQVASTFKDDFAEMQILLDSSLYILSEVEKLVSESDISDHLKRTTTATSTFRVEYVTPLPIGKHVDIFQEHIRDERFTLAGLMAGQHDKAKKDLERMTVHWPSGYTQHFKDAVKNINLAAEHNKRLDRMLWKPHTYKLWKAAFDVNLKKLLTEYLESPAASEDAINIIKSFLKGETRVRPIAIKNGAFSDEFHVSDAVFLTSKGKRTEGLFVFLGGNATVIESPVELFREGGKSIEEFPQLSSELSKRIPLKILLGRDDDDFKYSQGRSVWSHGIDYKWPYEPIVIGRIDGPNHYREQYDVFKVLFYSATVKARDNMDTRTSTWDERFIDKLLDVLADTLRYCAILSGFPGAPTAGLAFLLGAGASAVKYTQGELNDDPSEGNRLKAAAIKGLVTQIAAPYIGQVFGKVPNEAELFRITLKVYQLLKLSQDLPKEITQFFPEYGHHSTPLELSAKHFEKWIAPRVKNPLLVQEKLTRKFTNKRVSARLKSLSKKGPEAAQRLMDRSRVLYFSGPKEGFVYRGFTLCGDLRSPQEVFAQGFKMNAPVNNIQDINGMNANSGVDSGLKASGYYDNNGMGAFHQGGKSGGYTYLIDGRAMNGYDVARNRNWQADSGSRTGNDPYQIVYAQDIPGSMILGAYDSAGKFIPNQSALNRAIGKSSPGSSADEIPFPLAPLVHANNATQTPLKPQAY
ncbi:MAG: hypothetical protein I8H93_26420 [Pseudomonadales bacterium]|nr:hypothetical protein [Pseudomonadales bacterium]